MSILVTGGAGFIGSHTCVELLEDGREIVIVDNFSNSSPQSLNRIKQITGRDFPHYNVDLLDRENLLAVFNNHDFSAVIHFAALKAVGESVSKPLAYYKNNVAGSLILFELMEEFGVTNIVFSSSATVYGDPATVPITEDFPLNPTNPYGWTKVMMEQILIDHQRANPAWNVILLRYFNPVGAHPSGLIGEAPGGIPNNLMPYISQVAVNKLPFLKVFGDDYETEDGTGVRDYIHVVDLARGHLAALDKMDESDGLGIYNLGTGQGYSVLEMVNAFTEASGKPIPYKIVGRRDGDIATCFADSSKANTELGWKAEFGLNQMCLDTWRWQSMNPDGFN